MAPYQEGPALEGSLSHCLPSTSDEPYPQTSLSRRPSYSTNSPGLKALQGWKLIFETEQAVHLCGLS